MMNKLADEKNNDIDAYNSWLVSEEDTIIEAYGISLEDDTEEVPEVIYEGFLDDDYPKALDNYIENLSIDQVPDDFISSRYDKEMDNY